MAQPMVRCIASSASAESGEGTLTPTLCFDPPSSWPSISSCSSWLPFFLGECPDEYMSAIRLQRDLAIPVRAIDPRPYRFEALQNFGCGMAEGVAATCADERDLRPPG